MSLVCKYVIKNDSASEEIKKINVRVKFKLFIKKFAIYIELLVAKKYREWRKRKITDGPLLIPSTNRLSQNLEIFIGDSTK